MMRAQIHVRPVRQTNMGLLRGMIEDSDTGMAITSPANELICANKAFGLIFTWLLGQPVKDTLCGTKVLTRAHYDRIAANRAYFGDFDPFGDFDLLFGAAKLNLKIVDLPIHYKNRVYGSTNISRWKHGFLLLQMTGFAASKLKLI